MIAGSAPDYIEAAAAAGLRRLHHRRARRAGELGGERAGPIHFYAAGHHATEKLGVQRLGDLLAEQFGVTHEFVDIPNPI